MDGCLDASMHGRPCCDHGGPSLEKIIESLGAVATDQPDGGGIGRVPISGSIHLAPAALFISPHARKYRYIRGWMPHPTCLRYN